LIKLADATLPFVASLHGKFGGAHDARVERKIVVRITSTVSQLSMFLQSGAEPNLNGDASISIRLLILDVPSSGATSSFTSSISVVAPVVVSSVSSNITPHDRRDRAPHRHTRTSRAATCHADGVLVAHEDAAPAKQAVALAVCEFPTVLELLICSR
jgi:hypothetical protein